MKSPKVLDYLIIGGGPAGLQLAYYFQQNQRSYSVLEKAPVVGHFFTEYPRHRKLISINKVYTGYDDDKINLRWDWNSLLTDDTSHLFKQYTKDYFANPDHLVDYLADFVKKFNLNVHCNKEVAKVSREESVFVVKDSEENEWLATCVIVATGLFKIFTPKIPGIELIENYAGVSIDPDDFTNQRVLVLGKGNSGFETADNLISRASLIHVISRTPLKFAWKTHFPGHLRAVNNNLLDTYQLKSQNGIIDAEIRRITKNANNEYEVDMAYIQAENEVDTLTYDRIINCTGWQFDTSIFAESCKPDTVIDDRFPSIDSAWESTNIPGLFFAGTITQSLDFKKKQSAFIHGFRYNVRFLNHILELRYGEKNIPCKKISLDNKKITANIIARINKTSALWQQTGFLGDIITIDPKSDNMVSYYESVPIQYVHDGRLSDCPYYLTITLEFRQEYFDENPDTFNLKRVHKDDIKNADQSAALHPILSLYRKGAELLSQHHIIEEFSSVWKEKDKHITPTEKYLSGVIKSVSKGV